jgi:hypothetical protein
MYHARVPGASHSVPATGHQPSPRIWHPGSCRSRRVRVPACGASSDQAGGALLYTDSPKNTLSLLGHYVTMRSIHTDRNGLGTIGTS